MKKNLLIISCMFMMIFLSVNSINAQKSRSFQHDGYRYGMPDQSDIPINLDYINKNLDKYHTKLKGGNTLKSRWLDLAYELKYKQGGGPSVSFNFLFPDTTLLYDYKSYWGGPWVHGIETVFDPCSEWFGDDFVNTTEDLIVTEDMHYSLDSLKMHLFYSRGIPDPTIVDTMVFEIYTDNKTDNGCRKNLEQYYYTNSKYLFGHDTVRYKELKFNTDSKDQELKGCDIVTIKYPMTTKDTIRRFLYEHQIKIGLDDPIAVDPGKVVGVNIKFIPGYTWQPNIDTLIDFNVVRFLSFEERSSSFPSYEKGDWNCASIYPTGAKFYPTWDYYGTSMPSWAWPASYPFETHWVEFHISHDETDISSGFAGSDISICLGDSTILSSEFTEGESYAWSTGDSSASTTVSPLVTATYTLTATHKYQTETDEVVVTVINPPINLGGDTISCENSIDIDSDKSFVSYKWSNGSTISTATITTPNTYIVTVTDEYGCTASDDIAVSFTTKPIVTPGTVNPSCGSIANGSVFVNVTGGTGGYTYMWTPGGFTEDSISNVEAGMFTVSVSDSTCTTVETITLNEENAPIITLNKKGDTICFGDTVEISVTGSNLNQWTPTSNLQIAGNNKYLFFPLVSSSYKLTAYKDGCAAYEEISIKVKDLPKPNLGADTYIPPDNLPYDVFLSPGSDFLFYKWHDNSLSSSFSTTLTDIYPVTTDVKYFCEVTSQNGCTATDTIIFTVATESITSTFTAETPLCNGDVATITYTGNASSSADYHWDFDDGTIVSGSGQGPYEIFWDNDGEHTVSLYVIDNIKTSNITTQKVESFNTATFITSNNTTTFCNGDSVTLFANSVANLTYQWQYGANQNSYSNISGAKKPHLTVKDNGNMYYRVVVTDSLTNCSIESKALFIIINDNNFNIDFTANPQAITPPAVVAFNNQTASMSNYNYSWNFGDGTDSASNVTTLFYTYEYNGTYDITLSATNKATGCENSITKSNYILASGGISNTIKDNQQIRKTGDIIIFPNPFTNQTTIKFDNKNNSIYELAVTDISGKTVKRINNITESIVILKRENLNNGFYIVELIGENVFRGKMVLE